MSGLPFHPAARREYQAAILWHEKERPGFGELFLGEVEAKVELAARFPESGTAMESVAPGHDVRRYPLDRFSYKLIVATVRGQRTVVAVAHEARSPGYWRRRVR